MRLIPVLTAVLVILGLYALVFERDRLLDFARGGPSADAPSEAGTDAPAEVTDATPVTIPPPSAEPKRIGVVVIRSVAQTIDSAVVLRGETEADRQVEVRAETSGKVISEPLRKGSFVKSGDLLCQLDTGTRDATLAEAQARLEEARSRVPEAEARLEEARARLEEAQINDNAATKLSQGGYASDVRVAGTAAAVRSAEAAVSSAQSGLQTAEAGHPVGRGRGGRRRARDRPADHHGPVRGPAGKRHRRTGQPDAARQPLCATIIQLDPIKLVGFVPETEVNRVNVGALAGARLAAGASRCRAT